MDANPSKVWQPLAFRFAACIIELIPSEMAFGDVRHDEHDIPLKHESESAVLPFERSVHLHDAALIAQHLGAAAMDIAGIEEAVSIRHSLASGS